MSSNSAISHAFHCTVMESEDAFSCGKEKQREKGKNKGKRKEKGKRKQKEKKEEGEGGKK